MGEWAPAVGVIGLALVIGATLVLAGPVQGARGVDPRVVEDR